eukprot:CAMPEP_0181300090 /NCGR_PEP_ID=MMETSP1101-20121128/6698_1 /TAXON_ID=46948 /ORGANISM="Rhodomonas abbreviata, Strain Caron Lab Isolate" /LENGTH=330 /DNA_ID=CAMNT_0023405291 /DNA_START=151 /DNA_END=1141 /DNA_ORIENTATION=+
MTQTEKMRQRRQQELQQLGKPGMSCVPSGIPGGGWQKSAETASLHAHHLLDLRVQVTKVPPETFPMPRVQKPIFEDQRKKLPNNVSVIRVLDAFSTDAGTKGLRCEVHDGAPLQVFCTDCNNMVCYECAFLHHRSHDVQKPESMDPRVYEQREEVVRKLLARSCQKVEKLVAIEKTIDDAVNNVSDLGVAARIHVEDEYRERVRKLTEHRDELLNQIASIGERRTSYLKRTKEEISRTLSSVTEVQESASACLERRSRTKILCHEQQLRHKIRKTQSLTQSLELTLEGTRLELVPPQPSQVSACRLGEVVAEWRTPLHVFGRHGAAAGEL